MHVLSKDAGDTGTALKVMWALSVPWGSSEPPTPVLSQPSWEQQSEQQEEEGRARGCSVTWGAGTPRRSQPNLAVPGRLSSRARWNKPHPGGTGQGFPVNPQWSQ